MEFLILSRASAAAADVDDDGLDGRHWAYMDDYAEQMVARGPLLDRAADAWRGSMHVVDLPSVEDAGSFAADEPYERAGLFSDHLILGFRNLLGRTMWEYAGAPGERLFLVLARAGDEGSLDVPARQLVVHGELSEPGTGAPAGALLCVQAPSREVLDGWLAGATAEVYDWEFGGRR